MTHPPGKKQVHSWPNDVLSYAKAAAKTWPENQSSVKNERHRHKLQVTLRLFSRYLSRYMLPTL